MLAKLVCCSDLGDRDTVEMGEKNELLEKAAKKNKALESEGLEDYCWYIVVPGRQEK